MIIWQIIRRLATTAQNTPAGWLGTELPLKDLVSMRKDNRIKIALLDVVAINHGRVSLIRTESIDCFNVDDHDQDSTRKHQNE